MTITFKLDPEVDALYLRINAGDVARTVEVEESVFIDVDKDGNTLGLEFVNAEDFLPFIGRHGGQLGIPDHLGESTEDLFAVAD